MTRMMGGFIAKGPMVFQGEDQAEYQDGDQD
jgi:hypothetical protein